MTIIIIIIIIIITIIVYTFTIPNMHAKNIYNGEAMSQYRVNLHNIDIPYLVVRHSKLGIRLECYTTKYGMPRNWIGLSYIEDDIKGFNSQCE
jgi:hypothetical protein